MNELCKKVASINSFRSHFVQYDVEMVGKVSFSLGDFYPGVAPPFLNPGATPPFQNQVGDSRVFKAHCNDVLILLSVL
jgi:hypothetical protein